MRDLTKSFSIDYQSEDSGDRYMGTFACKKLTIRDLSRLGHRKAELCGGHSYNPETGKGIDPGTAMLNEMIAHCEIALISKPEWFDPENMTDLEVLNLVYKEVAAFEVNFRGDEPQVEESPFNGGGKVTSSSESPGNGRSPHSIESVVDKKIPKISPLS
jgi:hypothetical protein